MQFVFFGPEFNQRAPEIFGVMCTEPAAEWANITDIEAALIRGESVAIRPASAGEMKRAESYVALYEIGSMIAEKMGVLLDQESPAEATRKITAVRDAIESIDVELPGVLDCTKGA